MARGNARGEPVTTRVKVVKYTLAASTAMRLGVTSHKASATGPRVVAGLLREM